MAKHNFTKREQSIIAEYVHSYYADTLIVTDASDLLTLLKDHDMVDNYRELRDALDSKKDGIATTLANILHSKVDEEQGKEIMKSYYAGLL